MTPPIAYREDVISSIFGDTRIDPYDWLRDRNWPATNDPKILAYLEAENTYTKKVMQPFKALEENIYQELRNRVEEEVTSVPVHKDNFSYYSRTEKGKEYHVCCRKKKGEDTKEEIILDENKMAEGLSFFSMYHEVSYDHAYVAYGIDVQGDERYNLYIEHIATRKKYEEMIADVVDSVAWHPDAERKSGFFYVKANKEWRRDRVFYHILGTSPEQDICVYHETDVRYGLSIHITGSKRFLFINSGDHHSNEIWFIDLQSPSDAFSPVCIEKRKMGHIYEVDHRGEQFFIRTNDKGPAFRLMTCPITDFSYVYWEEYSPYQPEVYFKEFLLFKDHLVTLCTDKKALPFVTIYSFLSQDTHNVPFTEDIYHVALVATDFLSPSVRLHYTSFVTPHSVWEVDLNYNNKITLCYTQKIPSGYQPEHYHNERRWAVGRDGTHIPVSLVYKKDLFKEDGSNPLYLQGYGAYGFAIPIRFNGAALSLLDRGFVVSIAHIRGGDDVGYGWYEAGKLMHKKHSFEDFIDVAESLIAQKVTSKGHIVARGGSAGGMLMGAVANMRPDLWKAIIAHVPFVDVLNTMLDSSLPLTPGEYNEWGNPQEEASYAYIRSYSPYENIKAQEYPAMYVTAGLTDPRVTYWEAAKWVARLRYERTNEALLLLEIHMDSGHKGASGRFEYLKELAREYCFIFMLSIDPKK